MKTNTLENIFRHLVVFYLATGFIVGNKGFGMDSIRRKPSHS